MLSSKGKYGIKALLHLAEHEGAGAMLIADIAAVNCIPKKFLDAILLELKNAGFLHSKKGRGGGYTLAKPAERILIGDVIRTLDGPLAPIPCASRTAYRRCDDCKDVSGCRIRTLMLDVRDAVAGILDRTSLADLRARGLPAKVLLFYDI
ncbi:MAG: Rrf2 family transcriptional regulator [Defluviicoccus sp.]